MKIDLYAHILPHDWPNLDAKYGYAEDIHFDCKDIVDHFSEAMLEFWNDDARRICKKCGKRVEKAQPVKAL